MTLEQGLSPDAIREINRILQRRNRAEIGVKNGKLCVWELESKTKYEQPIARAVGTAKGVNY